MDKDFNDEEIELQDLSDEELEELEELERLDAEGLLNTWVFENRRFNEISDEDIEEALKLFPSNLNKNILDDIKPKLVIKSFINLVTGNQFLIEHTDSITREESKIKSINKYEKMFGKELSDKLRELNDKYGYNKLEEK